jgi:hypothetical protein
MPAGAILREMNWKSFGAASNPNDHEIKQS